MKHAPIAQRGASSLAIVLMLVGAVILAVSFAHRSLVFEQKTAANQHRSAQAFAAAEAGLEWAVAQLNLDAPLGDDCRPSAQADARSFRDRYLMPDAQGELVPRSSMPPPACETAPGGGWSCRCAADAASGGSTAAPGFTVQLAAGDRPGLLRLSSSGHQSGLSVRSQVLIGRVPGLFSEPAAALTLRQALSVDQAGLELEHRDPTSGGLTLHAGGEVQAPMLRVLSSPGTPASASRRERDELLASLSADGLFTSVFHMGKAAWRDQPAVHRIDCAQACDTALRQAAGAEVVHPLIWLDHGLTLSGPLELGQAARPVLLVVDGPVQLSGRLQVHGMVYTTGTEWRAPAQADIDGAVIAENSLSASGNTRIRHHAATLHLLHQRTGSFAPVPGSWRDF